MRCSARYIPFPPFAAWPRVAIELKYWRQALEELRDFRERAKAIQVEEAARFVTRATAVDTAAIEGLYPVDRGFTLSVAAQVGAWERAFEEKGAEARQHFEAQLRTSELVLDAATRHLPVVEVLIRALHQQACAAQESYKVWTSQGWQRHALTLGEYKRFPNNPSREDGSEHAYAPVDRVQEEMARLVDELESEAFDRASAPVQAAYAHYAFVSIHPFADGNGRVARALASIYLVRATSVPFLLFADEKPAYLDALETADRGSYRSLIEYVRDRSIGAMNYMALSLQKALVASAGEVRDDSWRSFGLFDPTDVELDALAMRLLDETAGEVQRALEAFTFLPSLRIVPRGSEGSEGLEWVPPSPPEGYRAVANPIDPRRLLVFDRSSSLDDGGFVAGLVPWVSLDGEHPMGLRVEESQRRARLEANPSDLTPDLSQSLRARLKLWAGVLAAEIARESRITAELPRKAG